MLHSTDGRLAAVTRQWDSDFRTTTSPVVRVQDLRTSYGDVGPVRGISFDLNVDQTFALLGVDPHRGVNEVIDVRLERPPLSSHPCDGARPA